MKTSISLLSLIILIVLLGGNAFSQQIPMQNFRPYDQRGLNVFETVKSDTVPFTGFKLRIGGGFTQQFQNLSHENVIDTLHKNNTFKLEPMPVFNPLIPSIIW